MTARRGNQWYVYVLLGLLSLFSLFPYLFTMSTSIKDGRALFEPLSIAFEPTMGNYRRVLVDRALHFYLTNSLMVALTSLALTLVLALLAAYGLTRTNMRRERHVALAMLCLRTVPAIAIVLPYFLIAQMLRIVDTIPLLVLAHMTFGLPLAIWLLRGFMREIPLEINEAATIDGAGHMTILLRMILPNMRPGIAATSIVLFVHSWNDYVFANVLTSVNSATFPTTMNFFLGINTIAYGEMAAAAVVGTLPVIVLAALAHRHLVRGFAHGAV